MIVYVLLPLSILVAITLTLQGTVQSIDAYVQATTLEDESQIIPLGPVASQVAIGQLGSNGEGFFNTGGGSPLSQSHRLLQFFRVLLHPPAPCILDFYLCATDSFEATRLFAFGNHAFTLNSRGDRRRLGARDI